MLIVVGDGGHQRMLHSPGSDHRRLAMEILRCVMPPDMCDELERKTDFEGTSEVVVDPGMCAILLKMHGR